MAKPPFMVGRIVEPPYFIDREEELASLVHGLGTLSQNFLLLAIRRMGKSSLLHNAVARVRLEYPEMLTVQVDCRRVSSPEGFGDHLIEAILAAHEERHPAKGWLRLKARLSKDRIVDVLPEVKKVGVKSIEGAFEAYLEFRERKIDANRFLERAFRFLAAFLKERKLEAVIILDEFQELERTAGGYVFQLFKSYSDQLANARFAFSGSAIGLLEDVFLKPNSPMYLMATKMTLGPLSEAHVVKFVTDRFRMAGIAIEHGAAAHLHDLTGGIPHYVQKVGLAVWLKCLHAGTDKVTAKDVDHAFQDVIWDCSGEFEARLERRYGPLQKDLLLALALHGKMRRSDLARAVKRPHGQISGALTNLEASMDIRKLERGVYEAADPVFTAWVRTSLK